jgi:membrane protease YdiL (CAAX protease family)
VLVWSIVGVIAAARTGKGGGQGDLLQALIGLVPVALPGSLIAGGIALLLVLRSWRKRLGAGALRSLLGLSWGRPRQVVNGALGGAALAMLILPLMGLVTHRPEPPDLITQLAGASNSTLRAWVISAVLLAPPIEELMFRGVLFGALANTWNIRAAAFISGGTFWLMHGPEFVHWPAAVAIGLLTIFATWLRVRSRLLGPSIAAHFGYNLVLATVISLAMVSGAGGTRWARDHHLQRIEWIWGWTANARW